MITSAVHHGIYVELPNTVEGLVKTEELPDGEYEYDGMMELRCPQTGRRFRVGDPVRRVAVRQGGCELGPGGLCACLTQAVGGVSRVASKKHI